MTSRDDIIDMTHKSNNSIEDVDTPPTLISKKRPSARPLWKDIAQQFDGYRELLGAFVIILNNVAWAPHTSKTRSKLLEQAEQWIVQRTKLSRLFGADIRCVMRELAVLAHMGVITVEEIGKQCLLITNTNKSTRSAAESDKLFIKARASKLGKCQHSKGSPILANANIQTPETWQMPTLELGKCQHSDSRNLANANIREFPSLYEKKIIKENIEEKEREEEKPSASNLSLNRRISFESNNNTAQILKVLGRGFEGQPFEKAVKPTPIEQIELGNIWYRWALGQDSMLKFSELEFIKGLGEIEKILKCGFSEIERLLKFAIKKEYYAARFLSPQCHLEEIKGRKMISMAFIEMKTSKGLKAK